jgi:hypothetical protein
MRRITRAKALHEAKKFIRQQLRLIYSFGDITLRIDSPTVGVFDDGMGYIYMPSRANYERVNPASSPSGIVFVDGSFLVFKEIFRYQYASETARTPEIRRIEYSYHYQRPQSNSFFRYDFHPNIGNMETHPLFHLHAGGWTDNADDFPPHVRFPVTEISLEEVINLVRASFWEIL